MKWIGMFRVRPGHSPKSEEVDLAIQKASDPVRYAQDIVRRFDDWKRYRANVMEEAVRRARWRSGGEHHIPCVSVNGRSSGYYEGRTEREFKKICAEIDMEREQCGSMPLGEIPPDDFIAEVSRCPPYL